MSHETGQASQHARQLLSALVHVADLARRADEGITAVLAEVEKTRNRGTVPISPRAGTGGVPGLLSGLAGDRVLLRRNAARLLSVLKDVSSLTGLQQWYLDQVRKDRRR